MSPTEGKNVRSNEEAWRWKRLPAANAACLKMHDRYSARQISSGERHSLSGLDLI